MAWLRTWGSLAVLLAGLAWIMLSESLLRSRQELLYRLEPAFAQCLTKAAGEICVVEYRLALANSGSARQELVQVRWPPPLADWQIDWNSQDLVGSAARRAEPRIERQSGRHEIRGLDPNTLLEFTLRCFDCSRAELEAARKAAVRIEAPGRIIDAEPRTTVFGRALTNAARLAGFLF